MPERVLDLATARLAAVAWSPTRSPGVGGPGVPPLLLVHGLGAGNLVWEPVGPRLADATGAEVVAIDLPGFGRTPRGGFRPTVGALAALVGEAADAGGAVVVGNSLGALLGLRVAQTHPAAIRGLVLVAPVPPLTTASPRALRALAWFGLAALPVLGAAMVSAWHRGQDAERATRRRLAAVLHRPHTVDPGLFARLVTETQERGHRDAARTYSLASRSMIVEGPRVWRDVAAVRCPVLVVHGARDTLVPAALLDGIRHRCPHWHTRLIEEAGHWPQVDQPDQFVDTVAAWIREQITAA